MPLYAREAFGAVSLTAPKLVDACLGLLVEALQHQIDPELGLMDPLSGGATPPDHYGQLSAAVAVRLHGLRGGACDSLWKTPLAVWQELEEPQTGHAPFNRFLLNLLAETDNPEPGGYRDSAELHRLAAARCPLNRAYPSNNWCLLADLCRLLETEPGQAQPPNLRLQQSFDRWMTPAGGFIDFPARPRSPSGVATPIAYHHKALFVAAVAAEYSGDDTWWPRIQRLLDWIHLAHDGHGWVGGYGRSTHSLFGDGCLVAALVLLGAADPQREDDDSLAQLLAGVLTRLDSQRRTNDGFFWLTPSCAPGAAGGWDQYMHLSVYNAWFAAIVAWARYRRERHPVGDWALNLSRVGGIEGAQPRAQEAFTPRPDIQRVQSDCGLSLWFSAQGQPPQAFSREEVDLRYAGGVPCHGRCGDRVVLPAAVRVQAEDLLDQPAVAGWTPVFQINERLFGLTDFESFSVSRDETGVEYRLTGCPRALLKRPADSISTRLIAALDWRLGLGWGKREALRRERLATVRGTLTLRLCDETPMLSVHWGLENEDGRRIQYLNPCGHALMASAFPRDRGVTVISGPGSDPAASASALRRVRMPSATGEALGFCLPTQVLPSGASHYGVALEWSPP